MITALGKTWKDSSLLSQVGKRLHQWGVKRTKEGGNAKECIWITGWTQMCLSTRVIALSERLSMFKQHHHHVQYIRNVLPLRPMTTVLSCITVFVLHVYFILPLHKMSEANTVSYFSLITIATSYFSESVSHYSIKWTDYYWIPQNSVLFNFLKKDWILCLQFS